MSKAIDRMDESRRPEREAVGRWLREQRETVGLKQKEVAAHWPSVTGGLTGCVANWEGGFNCPTLEQWADLKRIIGLPDEMDAEVWRLNGRKGQPGENWELREKVGDGKSGTTAIWSDGGMGEFDITAPATPEAERWEGWGTALKPAHEPIVVARKPLSGTVAQTVLEHGTGALNVDGCRVGQWSDFDRRNMAVSSRGNCAGEGHVGEFGFDGSEEPLEPNTAGRWPANVVLSHSEGCVQVGTRKVKSHNPDNKTLDEGADGEVYGDYQRRSAVGHASPDGTETVGAWDCAEGCAVRLLDEQTGELTSGRLEPHHTISSSPDRNSYGDLDSGQKVTGAFGGDSGGASRFFYCAKASRGERNAGLEGFEEEGGQRKYGGGHGLGKRECCICGSRSSPQYLGGPEPACGHNDWCIVDVPAEGRRYDIAPPKNNHPTVKPISLMRWLVRLVTPPGGTVLDPFAGSGTTGCAAVLEGFDFVGLEREEEYVRIAEARVAWWHKHRGDGEAAEILSAGEQRDSVEASGQLDMFDEDAA